jgi:hypothetical protein
MPLPPNGRDVAATTFGISRNMQLGLALSPETRNEIASYAAGGGNLNGSANQANLLGHAGTGADRVSVPRLFRVNYCGIV